MLPRRPCRIGEGDDLLGGDSGLKRGGALGEAPAVTAAVGCSRRRGRSVPDLNLEDLRVVPS